MLLKKRSVVERIVERYNLKEIKTVSRRFLYTLYEMPSKQFCDRNFKLQNDPLILFLPRHRFCDNYS